MKIAFRFLTIICVVITLSALLTHLLELPGKVKLSQEDYQTVQRIYSGWAWLGIFEIGAILLTLIWTVNARKKKSTFLFLICGLICFVISIVIFFVFTFPANTATANWTELTQNWRLLRTQWEYSHAARAVLNFSGFCSLLLALFKEKTNW